MTSLRAFALLALLMSGLLGFAPGARAATTCSVSPTDLNFGPVDASGYATAAATWTWTCNTNEFLAGNQAQVRMCFRIGAGGVSGSTVATRKMQSPAPNNDQLNFHLYSDPSHSVPWGDSVTPPTSVELPIAYPLTSIFGLFASGSDSGTITLYGRIPAQILAAGNYSNAFSGGNAQIVYRYNYTSTQPANCSAGGSVSNFTFTARADVPDQCTISTATDLDFGGNAGAISSNRDSTSAISLACRLRSTWDVGLNNGMNASGNVRRMRLNATSNHVNYQLYRDTGRSVRWGNTIGSDTRSGTSNATTTTLIVYGRVPGSPAQTVPAGTYNDVVTVTVTY